MKCVYYSRYPYKADDYKVVDAESHGCKWRGSAYDMPFRLYKAAACEGEFDSIDDFLSACFEAMDCPDCKGVEDYHQPFELDGVRVTPTKHFYGATNEMDGVYVIDGRFYAWGFEGRVKCETWRKAVDTINHYSRGGYIRGIDYSRED